MSDALDIPQFETKDEVFEFLKKNKTILIKQKKSAIKYADAISFVTPVFDSKKSDQSKASTTEELLSSDKIKAKIVINTTKLMDSHSDVHMNGIWTKSLKENPTSTHLQEHQMKFDSVISEDVKAYVQNLNWKTLGFNFEGTTQALTFDSLIEKDRNSFMFEQYAKGFVKQHSVGMQYVKIIMCINSDKDYYEEEKANFDKYYPEVANKEAVDAQGYFWAVTEAKVIEGSAVVRGSNFATPTRSVETEKDTEPPKGTQENEPSKDTQNKSKEFYTNLI
jgi:hypothetical protein